MIDRSFLTALCVVAMCGMMAIAVGCETERAPDEIDRTTEPEPQPADPTPEPPKQKEKLTKINGWNYLATGIFEEGEHQIIISDDANANGF